jgi:hypothetical protein
MFATATKPDAGAPVGPERLRQIKQRVTIPVFGIGGHHAGERRTGATGGGRMASASSRRCWARPTPPTPPAASPKCFELEHKFCTSVNRTNLAITHQTRHRVLPSRRRQHRRTVRITPARCAPTHPIARCPWHFVPVDRHLVRPRRRRKNPRHLRQEFTLYAQPTTQRRGKCFFSNYSCRTFSSSG